MSDTPVRKSVVEEPESIRDSLVEGAAVKGRARTGESDSGQTTEDLTMGRWLELKVVCDADVVEELAELFTQYGFNQGVVVEEVLANEGDGANLAFAPSKPVVVSSFLSTGDVPEKELEGIRMNVWNLRQALWILGRSRPVRELDVVERREEDWANAWKEHFSVHHVGNHVLVKAPWHDCAPQPGETVIELDTGMAFGTGRHASTQLCVQALEEELQAGDSVLDVRIGSGIVSIAAALLGASAVDGVDIDPEAIRVARENVERNGVGGIVRVALGSIGPDGPFPGPYDLVVANIISLVLIALAPALAHAVAPGGTLILAGIIDYKEEAVHELFSAESLTFVRRMQDEDWVALIWHRPDCMSGVPDGPEESDVRFSSESREN